MNQSALFGSPYDPFIQNLSAVIPQLLDDPLALREVIPMLAGVTEVQLLFAVSENFAQTRIVKQQATVLIDDDERRWTEIEYLAELALVLCRLDSESGAIMPPAGLISEDMQFSPANQWVKTSIEPHECPLWVKSRHHGTCDQCLLYPQKRTLELSRGMSAKCQK